MGGASPCRIDTIYGTWSFVRATRCSMPPQAAATYCHILDVVGPRIMDILDVVPCKGATISRIDILINLRSRTVVISSRLRILIIDDMTAVQIPRYTDN